MASITIKSFGSETDNITLHLIAEGYSEADYEVIVHGNTVAYNFVDVAAGIYTLKARKNNHVTSEYTVVVSSEDVVIDITLWQTGDITGDGVVNLKDLIRLKKILAGSADNDGAPEDYNNDGAVNALDLTALRKNMLGITA